MSIVSLISIIVCIYDKKISKRGNVRLRVPEKSLFLWSLLGGSVAMYITMRLIRHKTKHKSFMLGIPAIIILQAALMGVLIYYGILPL
ncbi:MAG: DUF1294 domain-containing protein [Clostridia bacterium]|nr:DUF1294 domain-containing protein [Clostridia bacterium]